MQIKSLKVFCDVVGWRSFSRAADENGISQSGASQVVHQLEQRLGVKLIDRSKRPFVLTPEGEAYYEGCRKLVQRYDALEEQVKTLHEEVSGRVRVVSIYSVGLHHMSRYVGQFLSQYPKANVRLEYQHPHKVYEAVEKDQADLGLVSYPRSSRTIEGVGWREEPMVLVCAPTHRLARLSKVSLEDLAGENMISFDADLTIRHEIDRVLQLHQAEVKVVMEFDNIETMKRAIEIDAGISLLPEPTVLREVEVGSLVAVPLDTDELVRPLGIIHRRGKELSSTARRFIALLQTEGLVVPDADKADQAKSCDASHSACDAPANGDASEFISAAATSTSADELHAAGNVHGNGSNGQNGSDHGAHAGDNGAHASGNGASPGGRRATNGHLVAAAPQAKGETREGKRPARVRAK